MDDELDSCAAALERGEQALLRGRLRQSDGDAGRLVELDLDLDGQVVPIRVAEEREGAAASFSELEASVLDRPLCSGVGATRARKAERSAIGWDERPTVDERSAFGSRDCHHALGGRPDFLVGQGGMRVALRWRQEDGAGHVARVGQLAVGQAALS